MNKQTLAWLLTLLLLMAAVLPASAATPRMQQVQPLLEAILQDEMTRSGANSLQAWIDGPLAQNAGQGAEWIILALSQLRDTDTLPACDLTAYRDSLTAFLAQDAAYGASTRQKYALCMLAAGGNASVAETAETTIGQQGIMSWIYGLHLLNNGCSNSQLTAADATAQLISLQLPDGGWAVMGQNADVDVTAMALQALAPHREEPVVAAAVEKAVALLATRQQEDGGFISMGQPNPESTAQVMIALCGLGIDPLEDERFRKDGATMLESILAYRLPSGGYGHTAGGEYSAAATAQVLDALAAYVRFVQGKTGLYQLDGAAAALMQPDATTNDELSLPTAADLPPTDKDALPSSSIGIMTDEGSTGDPSLPTAADFPPTDKNTLPASSIGIIGGADGPTAIFVTGMQSWKPVAVIVILLLAVVWCLSLRICRKGKLKNYLAMAIVVAVALGLVLSLDIQSPESYYGTAPVQDGTIIGTVTMEIRCDALVNTLSSDGIPKDGIILPESAFLLYEGDTVYDLLTRAVRQYQLHLDASGSDGMQYVVGLNHLYEQAYGELSGWMYLVNGESASQGCDQYRLTDGDHVSWQYTLEMGRDLE